MRIIHPVGKGTSDPPDTRLPLLMDKSIPHCESAYNIALVKYTDPKTHVKYGQKSDKSHSENQKNKEEVP
jgi:hypothetical protein